MTAGCRSSSPLFLHGIARDDLRLRRRIEVGRYQPLERYERAFYEPLVSERSNYEDWIGRGSPTTNERATQIWTQMLSEYQPPELDPAIADAIGVYTKRRAVEFMGR